LGNLEKLERIDQRIAELVVAQDSKKELEEHLDYIEQRQQALKDKVNRLYAFVDKEKAKFENLEANSVISLFYKVLGVHKGWYEQEEQDFVEAALKYNAAIDQLHLLDFEVKIVRRKIGSLEDVSFDIDNLLAEKQGIFNVYDAVEARKIGGYDTLIYTNRRQKNLAYKLIYEMDKILKDLHFILEVVSATGKWMLQNNGVRNLLPFKFNKQIKLASRAATRAQNNLDDFRAKLNKYDPSITVNRISITANYLDNLFRHLIKDWVADHYFKASEVQIQDTIVAMESSKQELEGKIEFYEKENEILAKDKMEYLIKLKF